jgi:hypothetical protein
MLQSNAKHWQADLTHTLSKRRGFAFRKHIEIRKVFPFFNRSFAGTTRCNRAVAGVFPAPFGPTRIFNPLFSLSLKSDSDLKPSTSIFVIILFFHV